MISENNGKGRKPGTLRALLINAVVNAAHLPLQEKQAGDGKARAGPENWEKMKMLFFYL